MSMAELCVFSMNFNIVVKLDDIAGHVTCGDPVRPECIDKFSLLRWMELLRCTLVGH